MQPEFLDEGGDAVSVLDTDDDVLDGDPPQAFPPWLVRGGLALAAVALVATGVLRGSGTATSLPRPTARSTVTPVPPDELVVRWLSVNDPVGAAVYGRAVDRAIAGDVIRSDTGTTCRQVRVGDSPQGAAMLVLLHTIPDLHAVDIARSLDQNAGLCSVQVRMRDSARSTTVVLTVTPPGPGPAIGRHDNVISSGDTPIGALRLRYVRFTTGPGWAVVVGSLGPARSAPPLRDLATIAVQPSLRW